MTSFSTGTRPKYSVSRSKGPSTTRWYFGEHLPSFFSFRYSSLSATEDSNTDERARGSDSKSTKLSRSITKLQKVNLRVRAANQSQKQETTVKK